jgi:hypothetical protein
MLPPSWSSLREGECEDARFVCPACLLTCRCINNTWPSRRESRSAVRGAGHPTGEMKPDTVLTQNDHALGKRGLESFNWKHRPTFVRSSHEPRVPCRTIAARPATSAIRDPSDLAGRRSAGRSARGSTETWLPIGRFAPRESSHGFVVGRQVRPKKEPRTRHPNLSKKTPRL